MNSSWLGQGLSSLKGQLTEFTKEVLTESTEEDPVDEAIQLKVAKERVQELETELKSLTNETTSLRSQNVELVESSQSLEIQMREMSDHYQAQLKAKEKEIIELKRERNNEEKHSFTIGPTEPDDFDHAFTPPESPGASDFEMVQLKDQIKQLKAEVQHWKTVVNTTSSESGDWESLVKENKQLRSQLEELVEKQHSEILTLQMHHTRQIESIRNEGKDTSSKSGWDDDDDWEEKDEQDDEEDSFDDPQLAGQLKDLHLQHETLQKENQKLVSAKKELEEAIHAKRDANDELKKTVDSLRSWDITSRDEADSSSDSRIEEMKQQLLDAEEGMTTLAADHEIAIDQILNSKKTIEEELKQKSSDLESANSEKSDFERQIRQLKAENAELTSAYDDLNTELEREKMETGNITSSNHELTDRLEGLKADLIEYEEKYETCKADNMKAREQLDALTQQFDRLKDDLGSAQSMSVGETKNLREEVNRLQNELYDSLKKRDNLAKEMNSFQDIVTRFENDMAQYRAVNEKLKEENDSLREQIQNLPGYREIFDETEKDLSQIRQSLSDYREEHSNTETRLQEEIKLLQEQNDLLKARFLEMSSSEAAPDEVENLRRLNEEQRRTIEEMSSVTPTPQNIEELHTSEHHFDDTVEEQRAKIADLEQLVQRFKNCIDADTFQQLTGTGDEIETMILVPQHLMTRSTPSQPSPSDQKDEDGGSSGDSTNGWDKLHEGHHDKESKGPSAMAAGSMSSGQLEIQLKEALAALTEKTEECEKLQKQITESSHELHEKEDLLQQVFTELKGLEMQIVDYREREDVLRGNIQKLTVETARKDAEMDALRKDFEDSAEREQELEEQMRRKEEELEETLQISLASQTEKNNEELAARQREGLEISHRLEDLVAEKENLESRIEILNNEATKNQEESDTLKSDLEAAIAEKTKLLASIAEKDASIQNLEQKLQVALSSAEGESSIIETLQQEKAQWYQAATQKHEENVRYHTELTRLTEILTNEKTLCTTETQRAEELQKKLSELEESQISAAANTEKKLTESLQENARLSSQIASLSDQLKSDQTSSQQLTDLRNQLESAQRAKNGLNGELAAERERANDLAQRIQAMEETRLKTQKESDRLRQHLVQVEENYTTEAVAAEERETELRNRVKALEQHLAFNSEEVKEKGQELGNKLEDAETQLRSMAQQRDAALLELADKQEEMEKLRNSLHSLQEVLQHFQQEKDSIVSDEVGRYRKQILALEGQKIALEEELSAKNEEIRNKQKEWSSTSELRQEMGGRDKRISELDTILKAKNKEITELKSKISTTLRVQGEKVDKDVLKNLFLSYFAAPKDKKHEVAHLLGSILSFTEEEFKKMDSTDGSWLAFLHRSGPSGTNPESSIGAQFVRFLEEESQRDAAKGDGRKPAPGLMTIPELPPARSSDGSRGSSRSATPTGAGNYLRQQMMMQSSSPGQPGSGPGSGFQLPSFSPDSTYMHSSSSTSDFLKDVLGER